MFARIERKMKCHKVLLCPEGTMNECRPILVWQRKGPEGFFTHIDYTQLS